MAWSPFSSESFQLQLPVLAHGASAWAFIPSEALPLAMAGCTIPLRVTWRLNTGMCSHELPSLTKDCLVVCRWGEPTPQERLAGLWTTGFKCCLEFHLHPLTLSMRDLVGSSTSRTWHLAHSPSLCLERGPIWRRQLSILAWGPLFVHLIR